MNIFNVVKEQASIIDVISEYTTLKKAGTYWKANCPFHHEKTASFTVSPHKEIFYCFGCNVSGDVIAFIAQIEHCSQLEAARFLAERYAIELPQQATLDAQHDAEFKKNQFYSINKHVALWAQEQLLKHGALLQYLRTRGINQTSIHDFTLGFFPGGLHAIKGLIQYMAAKSILVHDLIQAYILVEGKSVMYSPFEERLLFPIKDHLGRFCGFGGRIFKSGDERPKYYNSRENDFFIKGSLLFGFDSAKKSIQETGSVFLVEGYTDCIAMVQHKFSNTVATLGTACTSNHLKLLSRYAQQLYVLYDSDGAGQQAILRLTELSWQVNMDLQVISLPIGQDPASFLASGQLLLPYVQQAQDIFLFFINTLSQGFVNKPLQEKVQLTRKLIEIMSTINDPLKQDFLLQKASKTCDIPFQSLKEELIRLSQTHIQSQMQKPPLNIVESGNSIENGTHILEKKVFSAIINNIQLLNKDNERYLIDYMPNPLGNILKKVYHLNDVKLPWSFDHFFTILQEEEKHYVTKLLLENEATIEQHEFDQLVIQLHKKQWKLTVRDIKNQLLQAQQEGDEEKAQRLINDFLQLRKKIVSSTIQKNYKQF